MPHHGAPFPRRGPVGMVPPLRRYSEALRLLAARLAPLRFLRDFNTDVIAHAGDGEISQGSQGSLARVPRSTTPAKPPRRALGRARPSNASVLPSGNVSPSAFAERQISRLNHAAHVLAVYASQPRSPVTPVRPRKTRFRLGASLVRGGVEPAGDPACGFSRSFSVHRPVLPPHLGLQPGARHSLSNC